LNYLLLVLSFAIILAGALLFTNAVEWLGHRLKLGEGAVGSLLAAVGTAMPETLIAIVALIGAADGGQQGLELDAHGPTLERDLIFFLIFFAVSLALAWGAPDVLRIPVGIAVILAYVIYIRRTLRGSGDVQDHASLNPLIFERREEFRTNPSLLLCIVQLLVGLGAMVGGAHLFVEELLHIAELLGVEVVLALILAPLATELPEKVNSFFWVREGKDSLALGNITGAMVFQSTIPVGIGLVFTDWALSGNAALSVVLGLVGGFLAYEMLHRRDRFSLAAVVTWFMLYSAYIVVVAVGA
jgi:cation:H+ antiporter